jgi:hypothetical protein
MIRRFCDRCGVDMPDKPRNCVIVKFIKREVIVRNMEPNSNKTVELDLCSHCEDELRRFLNGEKKEC